ncbi:hypothetical protein C7S18_15950 [Ahniella affigens]|uniref:Uncharacterized protein n=1 Tax=Ahniella affigens TaxID=2021234 RepID=A0A2P1PUS7_9GAMM|nr:hypothetical protein [Ahniella affigens]AVP98589.1 hypothetical protein C7S18_15950 [Ahniella affigens]
MSITRSWTLTNVCSIYPTSGPGKQTIDINQPLMITPGSDADHVQVRFQYDNAGTAADFDRELALNPARDEIRAFINVAGNTVMTIGIRLVDDALIGFVSLKTGSEDSGGTWTGK